MALKQVHILGHAEDKLQKLVNSRKEAKKLGETKSANRQDIVADAIALLFKKEIKQ